MREPPPPGRGGGGGGGRGRKALQGDPQLTLSALEKMTPKR